MSSHIPWPDPMPFDTHWFVKRLTEAGMPAGQAEAIAYEQVIVFNDGRIMKKEGPRPLDTDRFIERMSAAGMPPGQAEALAEVMAALYNTEDAACPAPSAGAANSTTMGAPR